MSVLLTEKAKKNMRGGVLTTAKTCLRMIMFLKQRNLISWWLINFQAALLKVRFEFMLILKIETAAVSWSGQRFCWGNTELF